MELTQLKKTFFSVMYHYVRPQDDSRLRFLKLDDFKRQLDYFEQHFGIISKSEWEAYVRGHAMPEGVLLTFDDGLKDHFQFVAPELSSRGNFGLFFVNTDPIKGKALSVHISHFLLAHYSPAEILKKLLSTLGDGQRQIDGIARKAYSRQDHTEVEKTVKRLVNWALDLSDEHRDNVEGVFFEVAGLDPEEFTQRWNLSRDEIRQLGSEFEVGSHTESHRLLSRLTMQDQEDELGKSKEILEECVRRPVNSFCFPYGGRYSYTDTTLALLSQAGYSSAVSVYPEVISRETNKLELPRFDCNQFIDL